MILRRWWKQIVKKDPKLPRGAGRAGRGFQASSSRLLVETLEDRIVPDGGILDPSFGTGGIVSITMSNYNTSTLRGVAIQADGKIVAAGTVNDNADPQDFGLIRLNLNGSLDTTFGNGGRVITDFFEREDDAFAVVIQPNGKIVVGGGATIDSSFNTAFALARYNLDGTLDSTFGTSGRVTTEFAPADHFNRLSGITALTLQPDGRIVAAGNSSGKFVAARYLANGSLDSSFGNGGVATTTATSIAVSTNAVLLQADGRIVLGGQRGFSSALARFSSNGTLDTTFGVGGIATSTFGFGGGEAIRGLALQPDGKIVATGLVNVPAPSYSDISLMRYNANGSLDSTFGSGGLTHNGFSISYDEGVAIAVLATGKIIVVGVQGATGGSVSNVVGYNSNGSLDTTFGNGGSVVSNLVFPISYNCGAIALEPDGRIVTGSSSNGRQVYTLNRLLPGIPFTAAIIRLYQK